MLAFHLMAPRTTSFGRTGTPDVALAQNAQTPFDATERQVIDQQITDVQRYLATALVTGAVATYAQIDAGSPSLIGGDVVCIASSARLTVTLATAAALTAAGAPFGVVLGAGAPGSRIPIAVGGVVGPTITGLAASSGVCRVSTAGRCEKVTGYSTTDPAALGTINAQGWLVLSIRTLALPAVAVRLVLIAGAMQSTAAADGSGASLTTRPIHVAAELSAATSVTFWAFGGRTDVQASFHVELYNETDSVVVSNLSSSVTPSQLSEDVTATMLTAGEKVYSVRAWRADPAWVALTPYTTSPLSVVTNDSGKVYKCTTPGTSAGSGGPTGTGTGITDGSAVWAYVADNKVAVSACELRIS